jgi:hypothetical protein
MRLMDLDGCFTGAQLSSNLLVKHTGYNQSHHFTLARRQLIIAFP